MKEGLTACTFNEADGGDCSLIRPTTFVMKQTGRETWFAALDETGTRDMTSTVSFPSGRNGSEVLQSSPRDVSPAATLRRQNTDAMTNAGFSPSRSRPPGTGMPAGAGSAERRQTLRWACEIGTQRTSSPAPGEWPMDGVGEAEAVVHRRRNGGVVVHVVAS